MSVLDIDYRKERVGYWNTAYLRYDPKVKNPGVTQTVWYMRRTEFVAKRNTVKSRENIRSLKLQRPELCIARVIYSELPVKEYGVDHDHPLQKDIIRPMVGMNEAAMGSSRLV